MGPKFTLTPLHVHTQALKLAPVVSRGDLGLSDGRFYLKPGSARVQRG